MKMCMVLVLLAVIGLTLLDHRTVFRGKGGSRVCNKTAPCAVCTH